MATLPEVKCLCPDEGEVHLKDCAWVDASEEVEEWQDEFNGYAKQAIGQSTL